MQFPTTTPTQPPSVIIQQATEALDTWNQLGPIMGLLLVVALAVVAILVIAYFNRNSNAQALGVLVAANAEKEREVREFKERLEQEHAQHIESLSAIHAQTQRTNDLFEQNIKRGGERDAQQAEMLQNQLRIASAFENLLNNGSAPLQRVAADVAQLMIAVNNVDVRTMGWHEIMLSIPQWRIDVNKKLDELMVEVTKRATKPIPKVEIPPAGESGQS